MVDGYICDVCKKKKVAYEILWLSEFPVDWVDESMSNIDKRAIVENVDICLDCVDKISGFVKKLKE